MSWFFKQSQAIVEQNYVLGHFQLYFYQNIYFCEQCEGVKKLAVEFHLFN